MKIKRNRSKRFMDRIMAVLLAVVMVVPVGVIIAPSVGAEEAGNTVYGESNNFPVEEDYSIEQVESLSNYIIWGKVDDKFGLPVSSFIVICANVANNQSNYTYGYDGTYYFDLSIIDIAFGDEILLTATNGICIYNQSLTYEGASIQLNFVLDPEEPELPILPEFDVNNTDLPEFTDIDYTSPKFEEPDMRPDLFASSITFSNDEHVQGDSVLITVMAGTTGMFFDAFV